VKEPVTLQTCRAAGRQHNWAAVKKTNENTKKQHEENDKTE